MPAYDYRCLECSTVCEITRRALDDSPIACPSCGGATKQLFHPIGVHFKGSGFYNTDSRSAPSTETAATAAPEAPAAPAATACPSSGCSGCPAAE